MLFMRLHLFLCPELEPGRYAPCERTQVVTPRTETFCPDGFDPTMRSPRTREERAGQQLLRHRAAGMLCPLNPAIVVYVQCLDGSRAVVVWKMPHQDVREIALADFVSSTRLVLFSYPIYQPCASATHSPASQDLLRTLSILQSPGSRWTST